MSTKQQWVYFLEDWNANEGNPRGRLIVLLFRSGKATTYFSGVFRFFTFPVRFIYSVIVRYAMCVDLPLNAEIGGGLRIFHGMGLVVHPDVVIGRNCVLRQGVTIGERKTGTGAVPMVGNDVEFGCNSVVLGPVHIGDGALIGAGAVVLEPVPASGVMVGCSAKLIRVANQ